MYKGLVFLGEGLRNLRSIGSVTPSSRHLTHRLLRNVDFSHARCIVEWGPGLGTVTDSIINELGENATLVCCEVHTPFYDNLAGRITDKRVHIINDTAENLHEHLLRLRLPNPAYIISSIPLTNMSAQTRKTVLETAKQCLHDGGMYIQYQYIVPFSVREIKRYFPKTSLDFVFFNTPPAWVYECRK